MLALPFVQMFNEFEDVGFAKFPARIEIWRAAQDCQHFFTETIMSFLTDHSSDSTRAQLLVIAVYCSCLVLVVFWRGSLPFKRNPKNRDAQ